MQEKDRIKNQATEVLAAQHNRAVELEEKEPGLLITALNAAVNGIVITDREGTITWINAAFTRLTGYRYDEAVGQNPRLLKSGVQDPAYYENLWKTILSGQIWKGELINRRKDGSLYTDEQTITPVLGSGGAITHFIAIKQDITRQKRAAEVLYYAQELDEHLRQEQELRRKLENRVRELEALNHMFQKHLQERFTLVKSYQELTENLKDVCRRLQETISQADAVVLPQVESPLWNDIPDTGSDRS